MPETVHNTVGRSKKKHINTWRWGAMKCLKHIWPFKRTYTLLKSTDLWRLLHHFRSNSNSVGSTCLWLRLAFWAFSSRCAKQACLLLGVRIEGLKRAEKGLSFFFFFFFGPWIICAVLAQMQMWGDPAPYKWLKYACGASAVQMVFLHTLMKPVLYRTKNTVACQTGWWSILQPGT